MDNDNIEELSLAQSDACVATEESVPAQLPPLSDEEQIQLKLLDLHQCNPSNIQLELELKKIQRDHGVGFKSLKEAYANVEAQLAREAVPKPEPKSAEELMAQAQAQAEAAKWNELVTQYAQILAQSDDIFTELQHALRVHGYLADYKMAATLGITHGARLLKSSMGFVIKGASGSGKSGLVEAGAKFLPDEYIVSATSFSPKALNYIGDLTHKYCIGGEMPILKPGEDDPTQQAFRQLISENKITHVTVEPSDSGYVSTTHETKGPVVFVRTTTLEQTDFNDEFSNRLSWFATSDQADLTREVLAMQAKMASTPPDEKEQLSKKLDIEGWQHYHRNLKPLDVVIPYAEQIMPEYVVVTTRRLFPMMLNYIKASALLHQATRVLLDGPAPYVEANLFDYRVAYDLINNNAPRILDLVSDKGRDLYERLVKLFANHVFTREEAQREAAMSLPMAKRYLRELKEAGCIQVVQKDGKAFVYKIVDKPKAKQALLLVHPDNVRYPSGDMGQTHLYQ